MHDPIKHWGYKSGLDGFWTEAGEASKPKMKLGTHPISSNGLTPRYNHHRILKMMAEKPAAWWIAGDLCALTGLSARQLESAIQALCRMAFVERVKGHNFKGGRKPNNYRLTASGVDASVHPLEYLQRRMAGERYR